MGQLTSVQFPDHAESELSHVMEPVVVCVCVGGGGGVFVCVCVVVLLFHGGESLGSFAKNRCSRTSTHRHARPGTRARAVCGKVHQGYFQSMLRASCPM